MHLKIHRRYRNVVALCDSDLIGRKFEEGNLQLNIAENFYKDQEVTKEQAILIMKKEAQNDATFNIAGSESISAALEAGLVAKDHVGRISNIPYTLIF